MLAIALAPLLNEEDREHYAQLSREDRSRFARESHAADIAALERRERLQRERDTLMLDDEGGGIRTTRGGRAKKERKKARKEKKAQQRLSKLDRVKADSQEFVDDDDESSDSYSAASDSSSEGDSDDSSRPRKRKVVKPTRQLSEKQIEYRKKMQEEKQKKEQIISARQEDVRKEKANQAKRRLEFLLKQSNIFSHFGAVKQDTAKYGIKTGAPKKSTDGSSRRDAGDEDDDLEEADESKATFLTSQPTTLGFGTMRQYQLEGLNWMVRLQENGVNGILADEVRMLQVVGAFGLESFNFG